MYPKMIDIDKFLQENDLVFHDHNLLQMALTHSSFTQENHSVVSNQRLEFLGDAILNFVVAEYIYRHYQHEPEGVLTKIRARVVCEPALTQVAKNIDIGNYIYLGKGEEISGGRERKSILADALEALIGAIYLDRGLEAAREFIHKKFAHIIIDTASGDYYDYKSRLQELVQSKSQENVYYQILEENGPPHARTFIAGVFYKDVLLATGQGHSKKEAEQQAAGKIIRDTENLQLLMLEEG